mmetsp:Transcript_15703/g.21819  ORF Transcript_15703/g.21819 Transcript_15703/m.21819 type:complete len:218 (+) Transcript_15703:183-836(+)
MVFSVATMSANVNVATSITALKPVSEAFLGTAAAATAAMALRGGDATVAADAVLDLNRVRIRLEGLSSYGVISSLLMNATLGIFGMTREKIIKKEDSTVDRTVKTIFLSLVSLSIITGFYTTIVFTLLVLYSKTALGMANDDAFLKFFSQTAHARQTGFQSFIVSLVSFTASFCLSLIINYEGPIRWYASSLSALLAILSMVSWSKLISFGGEIVFS